MKQLQPRVRFSNLKHMSRSPAHYRASVEQPFSPTKAMRIGWLADALFYGTNLPPIWDGERRGNAWKYINTPKDQLVVYDGERKGKAWKLFKEANPDKEIFTTAEVNEAQTQIDFEAKHQGQETYTSAEVLEAKPIAEALRQHGRAFDLLTTGQHRQRHIEWKWLDRECRGTPDVAGSGSVVELKTTTNAEPGWFQRHAIQLGYHAQLWWYRNGLIQMGEIRHATCLIVAVEQKPPYAISVHRLTERTLELGERCCRAWMERLLLCERDDVWPGYAPVDNDMDALPDVALTLDGEEV